MCDKPISNQAACTRPQKSNTGCEVLYELSKLGLSDFPRNGRDTYWETQADIDRNQQYPPPPKYRGN